MDWAALDPEDYYILGDDHKMYSPVTQTKNLTFHFTAKRLTIGEADGMPGYLDVRVYAIDGSTVCYFDGDGLYLENGWLQANGYSTREHPVEGKITVTASASAPFRLGQDKRYHSMILSLRGPLYGAAGTGLLVTDKLGVSPATNFTARISGNCEEFYGSIVVTSELARTASVYGSALQLASVSMPGSVTIETNAVLKTFRSTDIAEIGSLSLRSGSCIALTTGTTGGKLTNGYFRATGSFSAAGPVAVTVPSSVVPLDTTVIRLPVV